MPKTIVLTDLEMENIQIFKQANEEGQLEMAISCNYTLTNADDARDGANKVFELTAQQKIQILNFIKPFVQAIATEEDVNPPPWAA